MPKTPEKYVDIISLMLKDTNVKVPMNHHSTFWLKKSFKTLDK